MTLVVDAPFKNLRPGLEIPDDDLVVFTGPNNSGKSAILQWLNIRSPIAPQSDYVSPRRFDLSNEVAIALNSDQEMVSLFNQRKQYNEALAELTAPDPIRELVHLSDKDRARVVSWHNRYFGELRVERSHSNNKFAPPRITIDGRLATQQGSGSRAVLSILVALLGPRSSTILIDEPEIGIEPQVQRRLNELILEVSRTTSRWRRKRIYLATHSHLFLDRDELSHNHVVTKGVDGYAQLRRVDSMEALQNLVYTLLGNTPGDLFFPDNVLVVEGPSDEIFWRRILELSGSKGIAVHYGDGDGSIAAALPAIEQMLKTQVYIPFWYRDRICVAVDGDVPDARIEEWRLFLRDDGTRVRRLTKAGIEYFYPAAVLERVTGLDRGELDGARTAFLASLRAGARTARLGSFVGTKRQLALAVVAVMTGDTFDELDPELIAVLDALRGHSMSTTGLPAFRAEADELHATPR